MTVRNLGSLLRPKSVALIGASARPRSIGNVVAHNLTAGGFGGPIWFVNPSGAMIDGRPCYPSVGALPSLSTVGALVQKAVSRL